MAEKTLNARFQLKYDKLADWQKTDTPNQGANLVLKKGEIAFCEIPTNGGKVGQETPPAVMFKVGDGEKTFAELPWGTGLAGDVYDWAKKSGIEISTSGSGSFVSNLTWDAVNKKLVITKSNVSGFVPTNRTIAEVNLEDNVTKAELLSALNVADGATKVTTETVAGWGYTKNTGTVTGVKMNGTTKTPTSGVVDLGTVITSHQDVSGKQNKAISLNGITATTVEGALTEINGVAKAKYSKPGNGIPKSDLAAAVQTSLGKADTALQSHQTIKALDTTSATALTTTASEAIAGSGTIKLHKVSKTGNYNDLLNKPTIPTIPSISIAAASGSGNVITGLSASGHTITPTKGISVYTKDEVNALVAGAVDYLGTVAKMDDVTAFNPSSVGDFCRVSAAFTLAAASSGTGAAVSLHAGDLLLCKALADGTTPVKWDVIHGEIDKNTWTANSASADGYVAKGSGHANKVWKTDGSGNPGWRDDANTTYSAGTGISIAGNVINHSNSVTAGTASGDASKTLTFGGTFTIPSVTYDAQGHIKSKATTTMTMPSNPDTNQKVKVGSTTFGNNDTVEFVAGSNVTLAPDATNKKITINSSYTDNNQKVKVGSITFGANTTVNIAAGSHASVTAANDTITVAAAWPTASDSGYAGINKTGTVTSVSAAANSGFKITGTASTTPTIDWDSNVILVFNGGSSTVNV